MSSSSSSSSPPAPSSNQRGQQQPVIQTLLESFTRCFNPLNHHSGSGCTKIIHGGCGSDDEEVEVVRRSSSYRDGESSTSASRAVSRSTSSSEAIKMKQSQDDGNKIHQGNRIVTSDDDATRRRSSHNHQSKLSGEYLEERSMKRKLEIFRCDGSTARLPPKPQPRQSTRDRSSPQSSTSSDDEDLIRLTNNSSSRKRFSCGINLNQDSPISNVARLLNIGIIEAQKPFGLCFATPVRASSHEDVSKFSDDRLTAEEFLQRHPHHTGKTNIPATTTNFVNANEITPDRNHHHNDGSINNTTAADSSYNEDETITSTLYFDHKYSHLVQTRPPMPLFREDMLNSGDGDGYCGDELSEIIKRRSSSLERRDNVEPPPPPFPTVEAVTNWRHRNPTPRNRGLFLESSEGCREGKKEECPSPAKRSHAYAKIVVDIHSNTKDGPGSPIRIRDESMSTSTADSAEESFHI